MLTSNEVERLREAIIATIAAPIVGSIEDYSWEAIFHYVKNIPLSDPTLGRTKLLHDAVDIRTETGWSLKTIQLSNLNPGFTFAFVIQRADVITKAQALGFPSLTVDSPPAILGEAVIRHWNDKLIQDRNLQGVTNSYEGILCKKKNAIEYVYIEYPLTPLDPTNFSWNWSVDRNTGLAGKGLHGKVNNKLALIWYRNQKQLFKVQTIPEQSIQITIERNRLTPEEYVKAILSTVQEKLSSEQADDDDDISGGYIQL
jgi:hypothetical protein